MDTILSEATHSVRHKIKNITGINCIERTCYLQGENIDAYNLYDKGSINGANLKGGASAKNNIVHGITTIDIKGTPPLTYHDSQEHLVVKDVTIRQAFGSTSRSVGIGSSVKCTFVGGLIENSASAFSISNTEALEEVSISDYYIKNVFQTGGGGCIVFTDGNSIGVGKIDLTNVKHTVQDMPHDDLSRGLYYLVDCGEIVVRNCTGVSRNQPFTLLTRITQKF